MTEIAARRDDVAHTLFQFLDLGKASFGGARPDGLLVNPDVKNSAAARLQRNLADVAGKRREQFLRHPGRAKQPAALGAIFDLNARMLHKPLTLRQRLEPLFHIGAEPVDVAQHVLLDRQFRIVNERGQVHGER